MATNHLAAKDVVPTLRNDLNVTTPPAGTGAEVIKVGPAEGKDRMTMHGFEFSIARMLDGKRTAEDVMINCARLGLPLNLTALEGFLHQLQSHNLLTQDHEALRQRGVSPWLKRSPWTEKVRELYRAAVRSAREGDIETAGVTVSRLLTLSPHNTEARRLHDWLELHRNDADPRGAFQRLFHDVEQSWMVEGAAETRETFVEKAARPSAFPFVVGAIGVAFLVAALVVPLPRSVNASAQLSPMTEATVPAPHAGLIDAVEVTEGDQVAAGQVLFTYDAAALQTKLAAAQQKLENARVPLRDAVGATREGRPLMTRFNKAQADANRAQAALLAAQKTSAGEEPTQAVIAAERRFADANTMVASTRESIDALVQPDEMQRAQMIAINSEIAAVQGQMRSMEVKAPNAGTVHNLAIRDGQEVTEGQTLVRVDDVHALKMVALVTPRQASSIHPGEPLVIDFGSQQRVTTTIDSVSGFELAAEVPNADGALKTGSMSVDLELKPASVIQRMR